MKNKKHKLASLLLTMGIGAGAIAGVSTAVACAPNNTKVPDNQQTYTQQLEDLQNKIDELEQEIAEQEANNQQFQDKLNQQQQNQNKQQNQLDKLQDMVTASDSTELYRALTQLCLDKTLSTPQVINWSDEQHHVEIYYYLPDGQDFTYAGTFGNLRIIQNNFFTITKLSTGEEKFDFGTDKTNVIPISNYMNDKDIQIVKDGANYQILNKGGDVVYSYSLKNGFITSYSEHIRDGSIETLNLKNEDSSVVEENIEEIGGQISSYQNYKSVNEFMNVMAESSYLSCDCNYNKTNNGEEKVTGNGTIIVSRTKAAKKESYLIESKNGSKNNEVNFVIDENEFRYAKKQDGIYDSDNTGIGHQAFSIKEFIQDTKSILFESFDSSNEYSGLVKITKENDTIKFVYNDGTIDVDLNSENNEITLNIDRRGSQTSSHKQKLVLKSISKAEFNKLYNEIETKVDDMLAEYQAEKGSSL